jgi:hypothetical protein
MTGVISADLALLQAPTIEVRDNTGELVGRIDRARADELVARGWADPVGRHEVKYLRLRPDAPWRPLSRGWSGGSNTTRPLRADHTCKSFEPSQVMGNPRTLREHKPLR